MNPLDNTLPVLVLTTEGSARLRLTIRSSGLTEEVTAVGDEAARQECVRARSVPR